jgi:two-component system, NtrC family, sensor histidine kinase HydH
MIGALKVEHLFKKRSRLDLSIWVVVGAIVVVAIIAAVMTLAHFQRQKEQAVELLVEKGATLIRSFEAGLRTPANMKDGTFGLQKLLLETAQQPDIDYIIVTNGSGNIIADSDPSSVGDEYGLDLDIGLIASAKNIQWRQVANPEGAGTFEVYRGFFPQERFDETKISPKINSKSPSKNSMIIYVGFNMAAIEKADKEDTRNTIIIALILLLIGSSAIVSLFLAQAYRLARTSLSRITIFSEALVKNMPIGLIAMDESGWIATCNEKAGAILNIDCSNAVGQQADLILTVPLLAILNELSEHDSLVEKDLQLISGNNEQKTLEVVAAALSDKDRLAGRIMLLRDVTTIRQLENEVAKSRHLTSIGSLAAGVAHEIRNPLSSIKGFAVYFRERLAGNDEDQKTADIMIKEVERLNRVISQLIEFARPLELKLEKVQLNEIVQHTIAVIAAEIQKNGVNIIVAPAIDLPLVEVDSDKIKQVLLNIFLNSMAAMKNGGKLSINFSTGTGHIDVVIADSGVGIDQMDLPRIYDPYFTSKPAGTGLGLAVVQKIMEAHSGTINVESAIGKGTTVILHFPFLQ